MGLKPLFTNQWIDDKLNQAREEYVNKMVRILKQVGNQCVNEAKSNGSYQDQTANLRNSIGFIIMVDGERVWEDFSITARGTVPSEEDPLEYGQNLARRVAKDFGDIALIVVAGMKYAVYVESKGRVVLTTAEQLAKAKVPFLLKQLK